MSRRHESCRGEYVLWLLRIFGYCNPLSVASPRHFFIPLFLIYMHLARSLSAACHSSFWILSKMFRANGERDTKKINPPVICIAILSYKRTTSAPLPGLHQPDLHRPTCQLQQQLFVSRRSSRVAAEVRETESRSKKPSESPARIASFLEEARGLAVRGRKANKRSDCYCFSIRPISDRSVLLSRVSSHHSATNNTRYYISSSCLLDVGSLATFRRDSWLS